jgi:hypothetical protein
MLGFYEIKTLDCRLARDLLLKVAQQQRKSKS